MRCRRFAITLLISTCDIVQAATIVLLLLSWVGNFSVKIYGLRFAS